MIINLTMDVAQYLHKQGLGIFDLAGSSGNIFCDYSPVTPVNKICLYQEGGLQRELSYRGDIRHPILHVECSNSSRVELLAVLNGIVALLEQQVFDTENCGYFFRLQSEPITWRLKDDEFKGSVNFIVTQEIRN